MNIKKDPSSAISLGEANWYLPRIVVKNDRIVVLNNGVHSEYDIADETSDDEAVPVIDLKLDEGGFNMILEEVVDNPSEMSGSNDGDSLDKSVSFGQLNTIKDSYKSKDQKEEIDVSKAYDNVSKPSDKTLSSSSDSALANEDYIPVERKANSGEVVIDVEEARRGGRSMLEISGFRDNEAEEKRKEKFRLSRY